MTPASALVRSPADLPRLERSFRAMRRDQPRLGQALVSALAVIVENTAGSDPEFGALRGVGMEIVARIDRAAQAGPELAYHNRHHFSEATLAMGWLCRAALDGGLIDIRQAVLGVVAMVGHDIGHDGSWEQDGQLEARSAAAVLRIASEVGLNRSDCGALHDIVLATAIPMVRWNRLRATEQLGAGISSTGLPALHLMAGEADILASLLPKLGCRLGGALSREWHRGPDAPRPRYRGVEPASFAGRLAFLCLNHQFTPAAASLGLAALQARQMRAFREIGARLGGGGMRDAAAFLDGLEPRRAIRVFGATMVNMRDPVAVPRQNVN